MATIFVLLGFATFACGDPPEESEGCMPQSSCEEAGAQCGVVPDGCGGELVCGECSPDEVCGSSNQCQANDLCEPTTCEELAATCGTLDDGCGAVLDCGTCDTPETCGGGGDANQCGCAPTTCAQEEAQCGTIADGCGGELTCGDCDGSLVCGALTPNRCDEPPDPCADPSVQPPPGWTRLTTGAFSCLFRAGVGIDFNADCSTWEGIWNLPFPGGGGAPHRLGIGRFSPQEYLAIEFHTDGLPTDRTAELIHEGPGSGVTVTPRIATVSACPGNFNFDAVAEETGCVFDLTNLITRIRIGGVDTNRACKVEPNQRYYLNIMHSLYSPGTAVSDLQSNCPPDTFCGVLYNPALN